MMERKSATFVQYCTKYYKILQNIIVLSPFLYSSLSYTEKEKQREKW